MRRNVTPMTTKRKTRTVQSVHKLMCICFAEKKVFFPLEQRGDRDCSTYLPIIQPTKQPTKPTMCINQSPEDNGTVRKSVHVFALHDEDFISVLSLDRLSFAGWRGGGVRNDSTLKS